MLRPVASQEDGTSGIGTVCADRRGKQRGFSLIEALVAISMLAIGLSAVASLLIGQLRANALNATTLRAISLAEAEMENLRGMRYADVVARTTTEGNYTVATQVQEDVPARFMKSITVSVGWTLHGASRTYSLNGIYTEIRR